MTALLQSFANFKQLKSDPARLLAVAMYSVYFCISGSLLTTISSRLQIIEIDPQWLLEVAPHYYKGKDLQEVSNAKMPKKVGATNEQTRSVQT